MVLILSPWREFLSFLLFCFVVGVVIYGTVQWYKSENHRELYNVPYSNHIERAVEVKNGENKFIEVRRVGIFGGGAAGGLGAPEIKVNSSQQFIDLVPLDETVYSFWDMGHATSGYLPHYLIREYWAFIENRAGMITWVDRLGIPTGCSYRNRTSSTILMVCEDMPQNGTLVGQ